jgi:hypothetical protein
MTEAPGRTAGTPSAEAAIRHIPLTAFGVSLSLFMAVSYFVCVLYGLLVSDTGMHQLLADVLPGFTWLTWPSFFIGLVWSVVFGWYVALVFGALFNWSASRFG